MTAYRSAAAHGAKLPEDIPAGLWLDLAPADWECSYGDRLAIRMDWIREDISIYYPDHVWIEGRDASGQWRQALVTVSAILAAITRYAGEDARGAALPPHPGSPIS